MKRRIEGDLTLKRRPSDVAGAPSGDCIGNVLCSLPDNVVSGVSVTIPPGGTPMKPASPKTLYIEDDIETDELITEELAEHGYIVIAAHDGEPGLATILREASGLVLYDIGMSGTTGFELLEQLRTPAPRYTKTPFVFLMAVAQREPGLCRRRLGADDHVIKPVDSEALASTVQTRLARRPRTHAAHPPI